MPIDVTDLGVLPFLVQLDPTVYVRVAQELGIDAAQRLHRAVLCSLSKVGGAYMLDIDAAVALAWGDLLPYDELLAG